MEKVYLASCNDELLFDDLEECVQFIVDNSEYPLTKTIDVFEKYQPTHKELLDVECVLETLQCRAEGIAGEFADDYTSELYFDKVKSKELFDTVLFWLDNNLDQPTFYTAGKLLDTLNVTKDLCNKFNIDLD